MSHTARISGYPFSDANQNPSHSYLLPALVRELGYLEAATERRLFDLGRGNGNLAAQSQSDGWDLIGIDPLSKGISEANARYPDLKLEVDSAYEDLAARFGRFQVKISLEVVEHLYAPRDCARTLADLLEAGRIGIVSTHYHGYWKD